MADDEHQRRLRVRLAQRYVLNPPMMFAVRLGLLRGYVLIETVGRQTGKRRRTVVGMHLEGVTGWVVAEQGHHAGYVLNIEVQPEVRVCIRGRWRRAHAELMPGDDAQARLDSFHRGGHASNVRRFGTELLTIRFDLS